jgi:hypothetical protein
MAYFPGNKDTSNICLRKFEELILGVRWFLLHTQDLNLYLVSNIRSQGGNSGDQK